MGRPTLTTGGAVHAREGLTWSFQKALNWRDTLIALKWRAHRFEVWLAGVLILFGANVALANEIAPPGVPWWSGSLAGYITATAGLVASLALLVKAVKQGRSTRREALSETFPKADSGPINSARLKDIEEAQAEYDRRQDRITREMRESIELVNAEIRRLVRQLHEQQEWLERARSEIVGHKKLDGPKE